MKRNPVLDTILAQVSEHGGCVISAETIASRWANLNSAQTCIRAKLKRAGYQVSIRDAGDDGVIVNATRAHTRDAPHRQVNSPATAIIKAQPGAAPGPANRVREDCPIDPGAMADFFAEADVEQLRAAWVAVLIDALTIGGERPSAYTRALLIVAIRCTVPGGDQLDRGALQRLLDETIARTPAPADGAAA